MAAQLLISEQKIFLSRVAPWVVKGFPPETKSRAELGAFGLFRYT
jgi:hypothetical protein